MSDAELRNPFGQQVAQAEDGSRTIVTPTPDTDDKGMPNADKGKDGDDAPTGDSAEKVATAVAEALKPLQETIAKQQETIQNQTENLKGQREKIKEGEKERKALFEKIQRSTDLSEEEREKMTDTEIATMDALADVQEKANEQHAKEQEAAENTEESEEVQFARKQVQTAIQNTALQLAGNDQEKANNIINEFNNYKDSDKLMTAEEITERLTRAARAIGDFAPARHEATPQGDAAGNSGGTGNKVDSLLDTYDETGSDQWNR